MWINMLLLQDRSQLRRVHLPKTIEHLKIFNNARETEVRLVCSWLSFVCVVSFDEFCFQNVFCRADLVFLVLSVLFVKSACIVNWMI